MWHGICGHQHLFSRPILKLGIFIPRVQNPHLELGKEVLLTVICKSSSRAGGGGVLRKVTPCRFMQHLPPFLLARFLPYTPFDEQ